VLKAKICRKIRQRLSDQDAGLYFILPENIYL